MLECHFQMTIMMASVIKPNMSAQNVLVVHNCALAYMCANRQTLAFSECQLEVGVDISRLTLTFHQGAGHGSAKRICRSACNANKQRRPGSKSDLS